MTCECSECKIKILGQTWDRGELCLLIGFFGICICMLFLMPFVKEGADCRSECNVALHSMYEQCAEVRGYYFANQLNVSYDGNWTTYKVSPYGINTSN